MSLTTGIPFRTLVEEDPHILSTYMAVIDEMAREGRGSGGNDAGL